MMTPETIRGVYTALITPFHNGQLDEEAFTHLIDWQIEQGISGLVPCGTTGESPALSHAEHKRIVELCIHHTARRVPVMAGSGSNSTREAIEFTLHAQNAGADLALLVAPYYNKPTQEGLFQHYKAIHDATEIPLIVYNIPGRSVINITDETFERLAELPRIAGIKDATGDLARVATLRAKVGNRLALLSGEDMTTVGFNAMGGQGLISVTSNVCPKESALIQQACQSGDFNGARALHDGLVALHTALFSETNPIPVKYAMKLIGKCTGEIRLPLVQPTEITCKSLEAVLKYMQLV